MAMIDAPNFSFWEFQSPDDAPFTEEIRHNIWTVARQLQALRDEIRKPINVTSGYRSEAYNDKLIAKGTGAVKKSQHTLGKAADIYAAGFTPDQIAEKIEGLIERGTMQQGGLGIYAGRNFVHYDIRGRRSRWRG